MNAHTRTTPWHDRSAARWSKVKRSSLAAAIVALLVGLNSDGPVATKLPSEAALAQTELAAPTNLSALGSQTQIGIGWVQSSRGETGFEVHRSATGALDSFELQATVGINATAFSDEGLTPGEHFCYRVRAVRVSMSTATYSGFSNIACTTAAPVAIVSLEAVYAGGAHTCALASVPGAAYCWGRGESGQLGVPAPPSTCYTGTEFFSCSMVPVPVGGGLTFERLAPGGSHTCALTELGAIYCWGDNERGQLGNGTSDTTPHALAEPVSGGLVFTALTAGLGRHSCGLADLGAAHCWGENTFGALGNRTRRDSAVPVAVFGNLNFDQLIAGGFIGHTCGVSDGAAYCWGENERGQVGDGTTRDRLVPKAVAGGLAFLNVDAGFRHTCGRASTGAVYCWGSNGTGQLGNNSNSHSKVPAKVFGQP